LHNILKYILKKFLNTSSLFKDIFLNLNNMNLFLLAITLKECAAAHCDKHCIKMILELTQMLYSAWWFGRDVFPLPELDPLPNDPYRPTHLNHPVSVWVRADPKHYQWTLNHRET
tara:strand:- start:148 stop:492 length:345 start_codon:yes stop_codon:yes gene_type:complete